MYIYRKIKLNLTKYSNTCSNHTIILTLESSDDISGNKTCLNVQRFRCWILPRSDHHQTNDRGNFLLIIQKQCLATQQAVSKSLEAHRYTKITKSLVNHIHLFDKTTLS